MSRIKITYRYSLLLSRKYGAEKTSFWRIEEVVFADCWPWTWNHVSSPTHNQLYSLHMTCTQMGDNKLLCTSLDSPSFIPSSLPHYKLYNPIFKLQLLNPKPTCNTSSKSRTRIKKNGLLNLTVLCAPISSAPSSPDFDIVSTSGTILLQLVSFL